MKKLNFTLYEDSYKAEDVPRVFWLVTSVDEYNEDFLEQLAKRKLVGVKGISSNKRIVLDFFQVGRNATLVMNAKKLLGMNNVSRILYDKPQYLLSNGMKALFRMFNKDPNNSLGKYGLMQNVMTYVNNLRSQFNLSKNVEAFGNIFYAIDYGTLSPTWYANKFSKENVQINNIKDLASWISKATIEIAEERAPHYVKYAKELSYKDWYPIIEKTIETIGKVYESESEWIVKDEVLDIPSDSVMFVSVEVPPKEIPKKFIILYNKYGEDADKVLPPGQSIPYNVKYTLKIISLIKEYGLDDIYKINYVVASKYEKIRSQLLSK